MKTRIVAGLVASLALLTAATADAGPKRHTPGAARRPAAAAHATAQPTHARAEKAPSSAAKAEKKDAATKTASVAHAEKKDAGTKTASVVHAEKKDAGTKTASVAHAEKKDAGTKTASVAHAEKSAHEGATRTASESEARPSTKSKGRAAAKAPAPSRFMASGIPLAEVREGRLQKVGTAKHPCGTRAGWAKKGSQWTALDAWGQIAGTLTVSGSERYDGTGCHQVSFAEGAGKDGPSVFVAKGSGYSPAASARWSPSADVVKRFERLYAAEATAWVDGKKPVGSDHGKTLFFSLPQQEGSPEGAPTERRPARWAVSGGRVLIVAYVGATGAWKVGHVLAPTGKDDAYQPLAVMDMDGDGLPEIVVHEEAGGVFSDRVLSFDAGAMRWEKTVESPGGATP